MLKIELRGNGVDNLISGIKECLECARDKKATKRYRDNMICRAIGQLDGLWELIRISEIEKEVTDKEAKDQND